MDGRISQKIVALKLLELNSIRITESINLLWFCTVFRGSCDVDIFNLTARA